LAGRSHDRAAQHVFHQHFNTGTTPARYLAFKHEATSIRNLQGVPKAWISRRVGGDQVDYADEKPSIRQAFTEALAQHGMKPKMEEAYNAELVELPPRVVHDRGLVALPGILRHNPAQTIVWAGVLKMAGEIPLILTLDNHGVPHRWVTWQQACFYYAKNLVAWTLGEREFTFHGGISQATGKRSSITARSIIAIKGKAMAMRAFNQVPPLNNRELFRRDRHICAYCAGGFSYLRLTRDHIRPVSRGGTDTWMNVVTACRSCNGVKRNRLPEESGLELIYALTCRTRPST